MNESYKILAQNNPTSGSLTNLYTVPDSTSTVVSSLIICNSSSSASTFSLSLAQGGAADTTKQYLYSSMPIAGNDTFIATIGVTLASGDVIRCNPGSSSLSFTVVGVEVS